MPELMPGMQPAEALPLWREGFGQVWHGWSCPGNIGCVTWRQRGARAVHLAGGT
jgi:hypothetical protein